MDPRPEEKNKQRDKKRERRYAPNDQRKPGLCSRVRARQRLGIKLRPYQIASPSAKKNPAAAIAANRTAETTIRSQDAPDRAASRNSHTPMAAEINIHNRAPLAPVCGPYGVFCRKKRLICLASKISAQGNHKTALDSAQT